MPTEALLCLRGSSAANKGIRERGHRKRGNSFTVSGINRSK